MIEDGRSRMEKSGGEARQTDQQPRRAPKQRLDTSRVEKGFGFRAQTFFREGLKRTVASYRTQLSQQGAV